MLDFFFFFKIWFINHWDLFGCCLPNSMLLFFNIVIHWIGQHLPNSSQFL